MANSYGAGKDSGSDSLELVPLGRLELARAAPLFYNACGEEKRACWGTAGKFTASAGKLPGKLACRHRAATVAHKAALDAHRVAPPEMRSNRFTMFTMFTQGAQTPGNT